MNVTVTFCLTMTIKYCSQFRLPPTLKRPPVPRSRRSPDSSPPPPPPPPPPLSASLRLLLLLSSHCHDPALSSGEHPVPEHDNLGLVVRNQFIKLFYLDVQLQ